MAGVLKPSDVPIDPGVHEPRRDPGAEEQVVQA